MDASVAAPSGRVGHQHLGRARTALGLEFAALVLGALALNATLLLGIRRPLTELKSIGDDHARAVVVATRIRNQLAESRRGLVQSVLDGQPASASVVDAQVLALGEATGMLQALANTPNERSGLTRLREALTRYGSNAHRVEEALAHDRLAAIRELPPALDQATAASDAADELVLFNAQQMRALAGRAEHAFTLTFVISSAAVLIVFASAILLLRLARGALSKYALAADRHGAELASFAGRAAHELRSPLSAIVLAIESARRGLPRGLDTAERCARRLAETIDELLEFSRAGAARADPSARCEVAAAIHEVLEELEPRRREADVPVTVTAPPAIAVPLAPAHLRTLLRNLVANAIRYSAGRPDARVEVEARVDGAEVAITVADRGPGIPPESLAHVFEPFYRASELPGGYGLGLATVRRLVDAHHGKIEIRGQLEEGTTIVLRFAVASAG